MMVENSIFPGFYCQSVVSAGPKKYNKVCQKEKNMLEGESFSISDMTG